MKIDNDLGNIVIVGFDRNESHILLPEFENFDDDGEIQKTILSLVEKELGSFNNIKEFSSEEQRTTGTYTVDGKSYTSPDYQLDIIEDEFYSGASGGTEQIILSLLSGSAGGIASVMTMKIFEVITNIISNASETKYQVKSVDDKFKIVERILFKRFKAVKPIKFIEVKNTKNTMECTVFDSKENSYIVKLTEKNGILNLNLKRA